MSDETIVENLHSTVESIMERTNAKGVFAQELLAKIRGLKDRLSELSHMERQEFLQKISDSYHNYTLIIEQKLLQYARFQSAYISSIYYGLLFVLFAICALFGYKLYKSLKEKELKRQEKLKLKQMKKSKKAN